MRLGGMFAQGRVSPVAVAVGVLGVMVPVLMAWLIQPLIAARAYRAQVFESEKFFWGVGKGGYVMEGYELAHCFFLLTATRKLLLGRRNKD